MTANKPAFRRGTEELEEAAKNAGASFQRDVFFSLEDGKSAILRFITEGDAHPDIEDSGFITVLQYGNIPTKEKPKDWPDGAKWPKSMPAVARSDEAFEGMFEDDYIADHMTDSKGNRYKPSPRYWAYACLREEVFGDGTDATGGPSMKGKLVGYRDQTREVTIKRDGKEEVIKEKAVVIVNMAYKNFFSTLIGFNRAYGTMLDRDYQITRVGSGPSDTDYRIVPLDPIKNLDLRDPETLKKYLPEKPLWEVVLGRADDEYYGRFFDPRVTIPTKQKDNDDGDSAEGAEKVDTAPDDERLAALRGRVTGYSKDEESPAAEESAEEQTEQPAPAAAASGPINFDS